MTKEREIILGLTSAIHDTSAALVIDGRIIVASEEERFSREKHSGKFPINAINFCLKQAAIVDINEIDEIAIGMDWMERAKARFELRFNKDCPKLSKQALKQSMADVQRAIDVEEILRKQFNYKGKINFYDHYDCHASACYFPSPFNNAAILILDGAGERASARIYHAKENKLEKIFQLDYPNSIGRFYGWVTNYLGFCIDSDEGKVMGLSSYGDESLVEKMREVVEIKNDGTYKLNLNFFAFVNDNTKGFSDKFIELFGPGREKDQEITQHHKNIAKAAQVILEEAMLNMAKLAKQLTAEENLCLGGGVALNSVANGKIVESKLFKDIYVYPASGDNGTGLGAALYRYHLHLDKKIFYKENQSPYTGYESMEKEILNAIKKYKLSYEKSNDIAKEIANLLANENKIIGHFSGKAEFGPRALGNRSILADPRNAENKDLVNKKIKFREGFRPFAPAVLEECADDYFDMHEVKSPYMILAFEARKDKKALIPAVVHVDGTARVQTINREQNERYWGIINEFYKITGVPVILNTSFNRAGEPIVNTPEEAIETFLGSALDVLVLGDYVIKK